MHRLLLTTSLILPLFAVPAFAQDAPAAPDQPDPMMGEQTEPLNGNTMEMDTAPDPLDSPDPAADPDMTDDAEPQFVNDTIMQQQASNELRVDWITGTTVRSLQDETIGNIADLIIDQESNEITAAIVSVGGFLGIGAKQIAVRFDELQIDFDAREIQLDMTRDQADAAPEYVFRDREDLPAPVVSNGAADPIAPLD